MNANKQRLLEILYGKSFIYREDPPFTLVSGRISPYYFDCKATSLDPEGAYLIGQLAFEAVKGDVPAALGGLTLGADPISVSTAIAAFANGMRINPLIVRKEPKKHGTQKWIEGHFTEGMRAVVVDDVITTGGSTITAIKRMRESGLDIIKAIVVIDREEGGREAIEELGVPVVSLFRRSDFDAIRLKK